MIDRLLIGSPKRASAPEVGWHSFFPYYAGFPESFARTLIASADLPNSAVVFDPWNGSGSTTYAAARLGLSSQGFDLNPVMVLVARARLLAPSEADCIDPLAAEVAKSARAARALEVDPLLLWFTYDTAAQVRGIERSICRHLVGRLTLASDGTHLERISALAAAFYVALFAVCRKMTEQFRSSNPTWLRVPRQGEEKVSATREWILSRFKADLSGMAIALQRMGVTEQSIYARARANIRLADTTCVEIQSESADFVLSSPPYCTRIDYTAATRIELAILSPSLNASSKDLARKMLGSTCVPTHDITISSSWGPTCNVFLETLSSHKSKASRGYYYKIHLDYFDKLKRSLENIHRASKPHGIVVLVVQDSHYKDIHNDLPTIICEMGLHIGLEPLRRQDFILDRSMSAVNRYSRIYRRPGRLTESVLCFRRSK